MTDEQPLTEPTIPTDDDVHAAAVTAAVATLDPLVVAAENARLRSSVRGAYGLLHALVKRLGGSTVVRAAEYRAIPPIERLTTDVDQETGDVTLTVDSAGHRKKRRT